MERETRAELARAKREIPAFPNTAPLYYSSARYAGKFSTNQFLVETELFMSQLVGDNVVMETVK